MAKTNKKQAAMEGEIIPLRVDGELVARIEAAQKRRGAARPKKAQVMRELMRLGLDVDEKRRG